jgi:galactose mutarotase-like enzyme
MIRSIAAGGIEVSVESKGAELASLRDRGGAERLWQGDPRFWGRRAPVLFPIVGRLVGDRYTFGGQEYLLGQHGFARDREFELADAGPDTLTYRLRSDGETVKVYPFHFEFSVRYSVEGTVLTVGYGVLNPGPAPMWFSIGAHPGFVCPFRPGERIEDYEIAFEGKETASRHFLKDGVFSGETAPLLCGQERLPLSEALFDRDAIVLKGLRSCRGTLRRRSGGPGLSVGFGGWPYLGIWKKPGAPFLCIEPWHGLADSAGSSGRLEDKEGILSLAPGRRFDCSFAVSVVGE